MFGVAESRTPGSGEKVLLRVFVHFHGRKVVLLLGGYDKGSDPKPKRQHREIETARKYLAEFRQQRRDRRSDGSPR